MNKKAEEMLQIKNHNLTVEINPKGAELTHLIDNKTGFDYIWNGEEWAKHAPILFPSIGRSTEDSYLLNGRTYPMQQHGFASDYVFETVKQAEDEIVLSFSDNEETFKSYPFHFNFQVSFKLTDHLLHVSFEVQNQSEEPLAFALGFHPAFNLPGKFEDYQLSLDTTEKLKQYEIVKNPFPYRSGKLLDFKPGKQFHLDRATFAAGLVILDNRIDKVSLTGQDYKVEMDTANFPYLCLWTKEDMPLPYLCLEPFQGLPDEIDEKQELLEKEGNVRLVAGTSSTFQTSIKFGEN